MRRTEKQTRKVAVAGEIEARLRLEAASVDAIRRESAAALEAARRETAAAITRANVAEARVRLLDQPRTPRVVRNIERIAVRLPFARRALRRREQRRIVREIRQSDFVRYWLLFCEQSRCRGERDRSRAAFRHKWLEGGP